VTTSIVRSWKRTFSVEGSDKSVVVTISVPRRHRSGSYFCKTTIAVGGRSDTRLDVGGADALQAILLAFSVLATMLRSSSRFSLESLRWNGEKDLGLKPFVG
jgi:hypothetical protein